MASELGGLYRDWLQLECTCVDRIFLRGYASILQSCGGFRTWAEQLRPGQPVTQAWIESLARRFHQNAKRFADERGLAIVVAKKGERKHLLADEYRRQFQGSEGVYLILKSHEKAKLFVSHEPAGCTPNNHRNLSRRWGFVAYYYFYIVDRYWGPICVSLCSHPPFTCRVWLNAHHWVERSAARGGLELKTKGNAFISSASPERVQALADQLTENDIRRVADRWVYRVLPVLSYKERRESRFQYNWSIAQLEVSHDLVFLPTFPVAELFQRHIDLNRRLFCPTSVATLFGKRQIHGANLGISVYQAHASQTVFRINYLGASLKIYDKYEQILRNECTCNDPTHFGVGKLLNNFASLRARMTATLKCFLQLQHSILDSTLGRGELAALAKTSELGHARVPGIRLENERILRVLHVVSRIGTDPKGFSAAQVRDAVSSVSAQPYSKAQACYDLRKLRAKRLVEPIPKTHRYRVSALGARLTPVLDKAHHLFLSPTLALASAPPPEPKPSSRGPTPQPAPANLKQLLARHAGNVNAVARALGRQACVIRRWIRRDCLDLTVYRTPVIRPKIEAAYAAVDDTLTRLAEAICLPAA